MELTYELLKTAIREVLQEEQWGKRRFFMAPKWEGGVLELKPGSPGLKSKEVPLDVFFKKITSVRERLRVLEQKINNSAAISQTEKAEMQTLIARSYGSLTTFNILFQEEEDKFEGMRGAE